MKKCIQINAISPIKLIFQSIKIANNKLPFTLTIIFPLKYKSYHNDHSVAKIASYLFCISQIFISGSQEWRTKSNTSAFSWEVNIRRTVIRKYFKKMFHLQFSGTTYLDIPLSNTSIF